MIIDKKELMRQLREDNLKGGYIKAEVIVGEGSESPYIDISGRDFSDFTDAKLIVAMELLVKNMKENANDNVKKLLQVIQAEYQGEINMDDN